MNAGYLFHPATQEDQDRFPEEEPYQLSYPEEADKWVYDPFDLQQPTPSAPSPRPSTPEVDPTDIEFDQSVSDEDVQGLVERYNTSLEEQRLLFLGKVTYAGVVGAMTGSRL